MPIKFKIFGRGGRGCARCHGVGREKPCDDRFTEGGTQKADNESSAEVRSHVTG